MRILLDENMPEAVASAFMGHEVSHVIAEGWAGIVNGKLLTLAEEGRFDVLVTFDKGIPHQHVLDGRRISIAVLKPEGQGIRATTNLIGDSLSEFDKIGPGEARILTNRRTRRP